MPYARLDAESARHLIDERDAVVLDIRDPESFAAARIEGARHLDQAGLEPFVRDADPGRPLIVCCYHGHSSQAAGAMLASRGIDEVYSLDGGFTGWATRFPDDIEGVAVG